MVRSARSPAIINSDHRRTTTDVTLFIYTPIDASTAARDRVSRSISTRVVVS